MQRTLEFATVIDRPVSLVYAHLANPANLLGLQPLLTSMSPIRETTIDGCRAFTYETVETFRLCGIPLIHNRIQVQTILTTPDQRMDSHVRSAPNLTLAVSYDFAAKDRRTWLTERMTITVAWWLMGFVVQQATRVQQQTLANLKARPKAISL
jgi:hypothetical protein